MLEQIGHPVLKLKRIRINGIELGNLKPGEYRYLKPEELSILRKEILNSKIK
jgi:23S rRNA pseudouridine2605 synthase